jgi:hypothetical protein
MAEITSPIAKRLSSTFFAQAFPQPAHFVAFGGSAFDEMVVVGSSMEEKERN